MPRILVPELLDSLPADDPGAIKSRRDLRRINALMGNFRWLRRRIQESAGPEDTIVEIGAGDGGLARNLCAGRPELARSWQALDLAPQPSGWPTAAIWHQANLWSPEGESCLAGATVVVANLVLHHFDDAELQRLGRMLPRCRLLLVCEPCRRESYVRQSRLLFPFIHRITRHDMVVSIRAGFRGRELADTLGLPPENWTCAASESWPGAYRLTATRTS